MNSDAGRVADAPTAMEPTLDDMTATILPAFGVDSMAGELRHVAMRRPGAILSCDWKRWHYGKPIDAPAMQRQFDIEEWQFDWALEQQVFVCDGGGGDVLALAEPSAGDLAEQLRFLIVVQRIGHRGLDETGCYTVHRDIARCDFGRQRLRHRHGRGRESAARAGPARPAR